ncbi:DUF3830 family protein [Colwelliaceae bacterium 6441]
MAKQTESFYWDEYWNNTRSGTTKIILSWDDGQCEGILFDKGVPKSVAGIISILPVTIPVVHVAWSGEMIMSTRPYDLGFKEKENETRLPRTGDISWDPFFGELAFTYGTAECKMQSGYNTIVICGQLKTGLDEFAKYCRARRFEGLAEVTISLAGEQ